MKSTLIILLIFIITLITPPAFAKNRALSLDWYGDYVRIPDADSLDLSNGMKLKAFRIPPKEVINNVRENFGYFGRMFVFDYSF